MENNSGKNQFLLGLLGGISVVSVIALIILSVAFINLSKNTGTSNNNNNAANANSAAQANNQPAEPIDIKVTQDDHIRGNFNAPITIVEWSDFQCPYCLRFNASVERIFAEYGDKVRWVYRHFPLDSIHPAARPAAEASECAAEQGKFWEFHDEIFANQSRLSSGKTLYTEIARDLKLDMDKFTDCVDARKYQNKVQTQTNDGLAVGVTGTPGSFLNGIELGGALPYEQLKPMIDDLLK